MTWLLPDPRPHPYAALAFAGIGRDGGSLHSGCDEVAGAEGEFGRSPGNPIPVNGLNGVLTYLDRLHPADGGTLLFHRIGSFTCAALGTQVVCLETVSTTGDGWDYLFFSLDHPWPTEKRPEGYLPAPDRPASGRPVGAVGTWHFCAEFPGELYAMPNRWQGSPLLGGGIARNPDTPFERPAEHSRRLARMLLDSRPRDGRQSPGRQTPQTDAALA